MTNALLDLDQDLDQHWACSRSVQVVPEVARKHL